MIRDVQSTPSASSTTPATQSHLPSRLRQQDGDRVRAHARAEADAEQRQHRQQGAGGASAGKQRRNLPALVLPGPEVLLDPVEDCGGRRAAAFGHRPHRATARCWLAGPRQVPPAPRAGC